MVAVALSGLIVALKNPGNVATGLFYIANVTLGVFGHFYAVEPELTAEGDAAAVLKLQEAFKTVTFIRMLNGYILMVVIAFFLIVLIFARGKIMELYAEKQTAKKLAEELKEGGQTEAALLNDLTKASDLEVANK